MDWSSWKKLAPAVNVFVMTGVQIPPDKFVDASTTATWLVRPIRAKPKPFVWKAGNAGSTGGFHGAVVSPPKVDVQPDFHVR